MKINHIYQGDCLKVMKTFEDNSVDLVLTDPPYFFETHGRGFSSERKKLFMGLKDIGVNKDKNYITTELLSEFLRICKEKNIFVFCNKAQIFNILSFAKKKQLNFELIPLCKNSPMPLSNNQWLPDREWGIHLFKNCSVKGNYKTKRGFFINNNYQQNKLDHPSVKPVDIIEKIILNLSNENNLILDPFLGSGTTAVACQNLKRNYIGIEINPKYIEMANDRLKQKPLF